MGPFLIVLALQPEVAESVNHRRSTEDLRTLMSYPCQKLQDEYNKSYKDKVYSEKGTRLKNCLSKTISNALDNLKTKYTNNKSDQYLSLKNLFATDEIGSVSQGIFAMNGDSINVDTPSGKQEFYKGYVIYAIRSVLPKKSEEKIIELYAQKNTSDKIDFMDIVSQLILGTKLLAVIKKHTKRENLDVKVIYDSLIDHSKNWTGKKSDNMILAPDQCRLIDAALLAHYFHTDIEYEERHLAVMTLLWQDRKYFEGELNSSLEDYGQFLELCEELGEEEFSDVCKAFDPSLTIEGPSTALVPTHNTTDHVANLSPPCN